jgi:hypothetical protein
LIPLKLGTFGGCGGLIGFDGGLSKDSSSLRPLVVKLLFSLYTLVTPSVVNRAGGFLSREAVICLERTSIRP